VTVANKEKKQDDEKEEGEMDLQGMAAKMLSSAMTTAKEKLMGMPEIDPINIKKAKR
jgi:hypothetical protein